MKASDIFSFSSGLKHNKSKSEFSEIGILEGGANWHSSMKGIHFTLSTVKTLGIHILCNKTTENDGNFLKHITNVERFLSYDEC